MTARNTLPEPHELIAAALDGVTEITTYGQDEDLYQVCRDTLVVTPAGDPNRPEAVDLKIHRAIRLRPVADHITFDVGFSLGEKPR